MTLVEKKYFAATVLYASSWRFVNAIVLVIHSPTEKSFNPKINKNNIKVGQATHYVFTRIYSWVGLGDLIFNIGTSRTSIEYKEH